MGERSRAEIEPDDVAAVERHRQAVELVAEIERFDDMKRVEGADQQRCGGLGDDAAGKAPREAVRA